MTMWSYRILISKRNLTVGIEVSALSMTTTYDHSFCNLFRMPTFGDEYQLRGLLTYLLKAFTNYHRSPQITSSLRPRTHTFFEGPGHLIIGTGEDAKPLGIEDKFDRLCADRCWPACFRKACRVAESRANKRTEQSPWLREKKAGGEKRRGLMPLHHIPLSQ